MILKGSQRAGAVQLARHLLRRDENDHVEVHELRGVSSGSLTGALQEMRAVAAGTRCKQFMFSLSLNPPETETVPVKVFEQAIAKIEDKLGVSGQPRAIVFHEKEGRRHAHCVWSRIDIEQMKAINLPHFKRKLQDVSKQLYLEHGWRMPAGLMNSQAKDPTTFNRAEYQQALRVGQDPKALKAQFLECWAAAKDRAALSSLLKERGFWLAKGDRRGFVAVDYRGEVYALAKWTGLKARDVKSKLGTPDDLPGVSQTRKEIAERMTPVLRGYIEDLERVKTTKVASLTLKKAQMKDRHVAERENLAEMQAQRWAEESKARAARFRKGIAFAWDWLTGKHREITKRNLAEAEAAKRRDADERETLIHRQLAARLDLQKHVRAARQQHAKDRAELDHEITRMLTPRGKEPENTQRSRATSGPEPRRAPAAHHSPNQGHDLDR
jgi:hypothetical protein